MSDQYEPNEHLENLVKERKIEESVLKYDMECMDKLDALNHRHPGMMPLNMALRVSLRHEILRGKARVRVLDAQIRALQPRLI